MKNLLIVAISIIISNAVVFAQNLSVSGRLIDENGAPVEFANIVVKSSDGSDPRGGTSNENGEFSFELGEGRFTLEASCIGYQTLTISCYAEDLGDITMPKDVEQLKGATVQAQRVVQKGGQYLVVPDPKDVDVSTKGIDLLSLQQLPGLKVDRALQSIKIDGGSPVLKINGREVQPNRLVNLDPKKVKRIEYTNSPGLRYLDRGATGVINIVLKEPDDGGSIYLYAGSDVLTMMNDAYVSGSYHKGKSEFSLQYEFSRRHYRNGPCEEEDSYISPERTVERMTKIDEPVRYAVNNLSAEYTFQPNDSTMFVAELRNNMMDGGRTGIGTMLRYENGVQSNYNIERTYSSGQIQPVLDLFFTHKMQKGQKIELNVVGEYSKSDLTTEIKYYSDAISTAESSFPTVVYNKGYAISGEGVYSKQLGKVETRMGVQYQHNFASNEYAVSKVISEMTKDNTYIFAQAGGPIGEDVNWTVGTGAKILAVTDGYAAETYVRNLSTAQLNWRMGERWSMTGEVRYTPALPSLGDLSPVFQRTDDVEAVQGNADLKPSQLLNNRLTVRFAAKNGWFTNITGGYDHYFGNIITTYWYDDETGLFVSSPQNSDYYNRAYVSAEAGVKDLFEHFNISLDGKLMREQTKGLGFHHINDNFSLNINTQAVWNKLVVGTYFNIRPEWFLYGEFLSKSERAQNIYAQYKWKNLSAQIIWLCPFNPKGFDYETIYLSDIHPGHHINWTSDNGNMIILGLTWNFDFGSAFNKGEKTLHNGGYDSGTVR